MKELIEGLEKKLRVFFRMSNKEIKREKLKYKEDLLRRVNIYLIGVLD